MHSENTHVFRTIYNILTKEINKRIASDMTNLLTIISSI